VTESATTDDGAVRDEVGMQASPETVLLIGGLLLTVVLFAVFIPFLARIWREDAARRGSGKGGA
jgi:hypothetical protein